jgi:hypothetical protein
MYAFVIRNGNHDVWPRNHQFFGAQQDSNSTRNWQRPHRSRVYRFWHHCLSAVIGVIFESFHIYFFPDPELCTEKNSMHSTHM